MAALLRFYISNSVLMMYLLLTILTVNSLMVLVLLSPTQHSKSAAVIPGTLVKEPSHVTSLAMFLPKTHRCAVVICIHASFHPLALVQVNSPSLMRAGSVEQYKRAFARQRARDLAHHADALLSKDKEIAALQQGCRDLEARLGSAKVRLPTVF